MLALKCLMAAMLASLARTSSSSAPAGHLSAALAEPAVDLKRDNSGTPTPALYTTDSIPESNGELPTFVTSVGLSNDNLTTMHNTVTAPSAGTTAVYVTETASKSRTAIPTSAILPSQYSTDTSLDLVQAAFSAEEVVVTTVTAKTTVLALVTASDSTDQLWTHTVVISGDGTHTDSVGPPTKTSDADTPSTTCTSTSTANGTSSLKSLVSTLGPTSLGSAALSSMWSSIVASHKSDHTVTTAAPVRSAMPSEPLQSTTTRVSSGAMKSIDDTTSCMLMLSFAPVGAGFALAFFL